MADLESELLETAIKTARKLGASYCDANILRRRSEFIQTKNDRLLALNRDATSGIGIRVLVDGGWGFASTQHLTSQAVAKCARLAVEVGAASSKCLVKPIEMVPEPIWNAIWVSPHLIDPEKIDLDSKLERLFTSAETILAVKGVTLAQGMLHFLRDEKFFASSEGSCIEQISLRTGCLIEATAAADGDQQRRSYPQSFGQYELAGFEMVERWNLPGHAKQIAEEAVALLSAPDCPAGQIDTIIGASQLALQIHESMGHPSELDRALGQEINFAGASFLKPDQLGALQYGSPLVNLVADATAPGALGSFGFDDEGVQAQKTYLVKDGLFKGFLTSRDTAASIGLSRSGGCMRAQSWNFAPIIRMTNISLEPGPVGGSLYDLVADTQDGLLMETNKSWSIDSMRYNFQFSTEAAWEIKNGKLGRLLKNPSYSGITPDFWNTCDAIAGPSDYVNWGTPNCGKGQPMQTMWTGHGASPARFRKLTIGAARN